MQTSRCYVNGIGEVVILTITGNADPNCFGCSMVINGSAEKCSAHNVVKTERTIMEEEYGEYLH